MKKLAIYFSTPGVYDYPLSKQVYLEAYSELIHKLDEKGVEAVVVRADSYKGDGVFDKYYTCSPSDLTYTEHKESIKVDLILNRDTDNTIPKIDDCKIINHTDLDELCRDKIATFEAFPRVSGATILANTYQEALEAIEKIPSDMIVLKPRFGEQSFGVYVLDRNVIAEDLYEDWSDILVQEFLDSSDGIPGLIEGLHEVNLYMIDGGFAGARIKQPPRGQYISSATGAVIGAVRGIHKEQIPDELWDAAREVDDELTGYSPRLTRADFVRTSNGRYRLIELNSRPGLMHADKEGPEYYWDFNGALVDSITNFMESL